MSWESERIQSILYSDTNVTGLLSTYVGDNSITYFAIWNDLIVPSWFTGTEAKGFTTINYYRIQSVNGGNNYGDYYYTISCRGNTLTYAENLQVAVFNALNRKASSNDGFFICTALPVIGPINDSTDNYNAPVEVRIKTR